MAKQVSAFLGYQGKLFATEAEADRSMLEEPYMRARDLLEAHLSDAQRRCAYTPMEALDRCVLYVKNYIKAYEAFYGEIT